MVEGILIWVVAEIRLISVILGGSFVYVVTQYKKATDPHHKGLRRRRYGCLSMIADGSAALFGGALFAIGAAWMGASEVGMVFMGGVGSLMGYSGLHMVASKASTKLDIWS